MLYIKKSGYKKERLWTINAKSGSRQHYLSDHLTPLLKTL